MMYQIFPQWYLHNVWSYISVLCQLCTVHAEKLPVVRFRRKFCHRIRFGNPDFPYGMEEWTFWRSVGIYQLVLPQFNLKCAEAAISKLPVKILTSSLASATPDLLKENSNSLIQLHIQVIFTVQLRSIHTVLLSRFCLSVRPSVCLSVKCVYCDKTKAPSEKSSIMTNRKSPTSFPMSLRWTLYIASDPQKRFFPFSV